MARIRSWADGQIALIWGQPDPAEQVRLAQGLLHMGKGLLTLNPVSSDGFLLNKVALSGLCSLTFR